MERVTAVPGSTYFYYPRLVCVVGVLDGDKETCNFAPVAWATPLSSAPPLYGVCLSPRTYTHKLALRAGEFTINFMAHDDAELVAAMGTLSGRTTDKVKALGLELDPPDALRTPTLAQAYASAECLLVARHQLGDQTLFAGEVHSIRHRPDAFDEAGVLRIQTIAPLLYLGAGRYLSGNPATVITPARQG